MSPSGSWSLLSHIQNCALWCKKLGCHCEIWKSFEKCDFGAKRCTGWPPSIKSELCHWIIWVFYLKSFKTMFSAFSATTQAKMDVAGLENDLETMFNRLSKNVLPLLAGPLIRTLWKFPLHCSRRFFTAWVKTSMGTWFYISTVLCKSNANVFRRNSRLFLAFRRKNIEFSMEANFQRKVTIIRGTYCSLLCEFSNDNSFGTKSDFEFSSEKALCSITDFKHMSEISLFISSAQTFPSILWTTILPSSKLPWWFFCAVISLSLSISITVL